MVRTGVQLNEELDDVRVNERVHERERKREIDASCTKSNRAHEIAT